MRAIDTNIVVRLLTADDPVQAKAARHIVKAGDIFIGVTVLLESEWVLRAGYDFSSQEVASGLRALGGLGGVVIEEPLQTAQALDWMSAGMDFADALHLARSGHCSAFVSFDRKLAKRAKDMAVIPVILS